MFTEIIHNPLYLRLFGSGGLVVVLLTILGIYLNNKRNRPDGGQSKPQSNSQSSSQSGSIAYNEVMIRFDSSAVPKIDSHSFQSSVDSSFYRSRISQEDRYPKISFSDEEFYENFLETIEVKRKKGDKIDYE